MIVDLEVELQSGWLNSPFVSSGGKYHVGLIVKDADGWIKALQNAGARGYVSSVPTPSEVARY